MLTDEEREFLKNITKYYNCISGIQFIKDAIDFRNNYSFTICILDYPKKLKFKNTERYRAYTLKELGLEEEV